MNPPQVYMCSPSWTLLPPPSPFHPSGSSQCTSPKHPVSCIEPGLATHFIHDIIHVSMPFSQIFPPSPSPTESKRLFYTSVSLFLSRIQGFWNICVYIWSIADVGGASDKDPSCQCRRCWRCGLDPWVRKIPCRRKWQPTPVFFPGESHGQRSLMDYSP